MDRWLQHEDRHGLTKTTRIESKIGEATSHVGRGLIAQNDEEVEGLAEESTISPARGLEVALVRRASTDIQPVPSSLHPVCAVLLVRLIVGRNGNLSRWRKVCRVC